MVKKIFSLTELPLKGKTVLVRVDYNVPLSKDRVKDKTKIKASLPTVKYLLRKKCKVVLMTHLGRPGGRTVVRLRTKGLVGELSRLLKKKVKFLSDCFGEEVKAEIEQSGEKVFLLENLRFYAEEKKNDYVFAHALADLGDFYVNEAFGVCHRKHASVSAVTKFVPSLGGFLLRKEMKELSRALEPVRPAIWVMGGAKLGKVELVEKALQKAEKVLIGGALAFSFLKAQGFQVGMSKIDLESVKAASRILKKRKWRKKIVLPIDAMVKSGRKVKRVMVNQIASDEVGLDIGLKTVKLFGESLKGAKTIVWNGPLGCFEVKPFEKGTKAIANILARSKAVTIIGGGETGEVVRQWKLAGKMTHVSTGGGAALAFLSGKKLAGIVALEENYKKFRKRLSL